MGSGFPLFPEQASTIASRVDALYYYLLSVSGFFVLLIFGLIFYFAIKYRRRSEDEQPRPILANLPLEIAWMIIPFILVMIMFAWGANLYFIATSSPPADALEIFVVGQQWMWKVQHPEGRREINELHVPVGYPVKLTITSQDVIHSFYVPAFRIKMDAVPGRYTSIWFEANKVGTYHLFCAEYCGTAHAGMGGQVVVMTPSEYERWLRIGAPDEPLVAAGARLFRELGCSGCHGPHSTVHAPPLEGVYGKPVPLQSGAVVVADEGYIRDSILLPQKDVVAGYAPIMPSFQGRVSEEELMQIIAYIRSLGGETPESRKAAR
jgi:cytochrome c oxidase subunit 2